MHVEWVKTAAKDRLFGKYGKCELLINKEGFQSPATVLSLVATSLSLSLQSTVSAEAWVFLWVASLLCAFLAKEKLIEGGKNRLLATEEPLIFSIFPAEDADKQRQYLSTQ